MPTRHPNSRNHRPHRAGLALLAGSPLVGQTLTPLS